MSDVAVVANPLRVDDVPTTRDELEQIAGEHGMGLLWLETTEADPGRGQARQAMEQGCAAVFSLGGDGTVRAVAESLVGSEVPLGLLPGGTGNLLMRNLELPVDSVAEAFRVGLEHEPRRIDVGRVRLDDDPEELFLVMCGMGLDAEAMADTPEEAKRRLGWISYGITGARKLFDKGIHIWVDTENAHFDQHVKSVLVGNCGQIQGGVALLPEAQVDDGQLDLLAFAPRGLAGWAAALWTIATRYRHGHPTLRKASGSEIRVRTKRPCEAEIDGDPVGPHTRLVARVEPGALLVRCPA